MVGARRPIYTSMAAYHLADLAPYGNEFPWECGH